MPVKHGILLNKHNKSSSDTHWHLTAQDSLSRLRARKTHTDEIADDLPKKKWHEEKLEPKSLRNPQTSAVDEGFIYKFTQ